MNTLDALAEFEAWQLKNPEFGPEQQLQWRAAYGRFGDSCEAHCFVAYMDGKARAQSDKS